MIGAVGNELVARYRIRVGRRIESEALVADGQHARTDALTSLTVVAAGVGAALGAALVDPFAVLAVALVILRLLVRSARSMTRRLLDAVDPQLVDTTETVVAEVSGVLGVTDHGMFHSIYFFDPNGHRMELACPDPEEAAMIAKADAVKWQMLEEWSRTKRAPRHGAFLHEREFNPAAAS